MAQAVKSLPAMQETWLRSLGREDPLEKEMTTHSSILAWRIPWTEEPGGPQRVRHDWTTNTFTLTWRLRPAQQHYTSSGPLPPPGLAHFHQKTGTAEGPLAGPRAQAEPSRHLCWSQGCLWEGRQGGCMKSSFLPRLQQGEECRPRLPLPSPRGIKDAALSWAPGPSICIHQVLELARWCRLHLLPGLPRLPPVRPCRWSLWVLTDWVQAWGGKVMEKGSWHMVHACPSGRLQVVRGLGKPGLWIRGALFNKPLCEEPSNLLSLIELEKLQAPFLSGDPLASSLISFIEAIVRGCISGNRDPPSPSQEGAYHIPDVRAVEQRSEPSREGGGSPGHDSGDSGPHQCFPM